MTTRKLVACITSLALAALVLGLPASAQDEEDDPCLEACWTVAQACYETCDVEGEQEDCEQACDEAVETCELACDD